jgi:hypothetical protein
MNCRGCSLKSDQLTALKDEMKGLKEALAYYAEAQRWSPMRIVDGQVTKVQMPFQFTVYADMGARARAALSAIAQRARTK